MEAEDLRDLFVKYAIRIDDDDYVRYLFKVPIFHPAVSPRNKNGGGYILGDSMEDCIHQFMNLDYACKNPINEQAAIKYKKENNSKFMAINEKITNQLKEKCKTCFEKLIIDESLCCVKGDVFCKDCFENTCRICQVDSDLSRFHKRQKK